MLLQHSSLWFSFIYSTVHGRFITRPDLNPPQLTIRSNRLSADDKDLIFATPYRSLQDGPVIYNLRGELVWDGHEPSSSVFTSRAGNFRTIWYRGSTHLAYTSTDEDEQGLRGNTTHKIFNSSYVNTASFNSLDANMELDGHDSELLDDGHRFLQAAKITHPSESGIKSGLEEAIVQEVDLENSMVVFDWRSLDHVPANDSCISHSEPDYFHINSAQRDSQGNYLIDGYNVCKIYYVNGSTGAIIWTLGGLNSSFQILDTQDIPYSLKHAHHARIHPLSLVHLPNSLPKPVSNKTHLALSLFDNAFGATSSPPTSRSSSALVLLLDLRTHIAHIIEHYPHPFGHTAAMFGSLTFLPNGDRFIGWGSSRDVSQHAPSGHLRFHAEIGTLDTLVGSYRAFKAPWSGRPDTRPDVYAYAWGCQWRTAVYTSWNGATEVCSYRIFGREPGGRWARVAEMEKRGFETRGRAERYVEWVFVEALDEAGRVLGRSKAVRTYRPPLVEARGCSEWMCPATLRLPRDEGSCGCEGVGVEDQTALG